MNGGFKCITVPDDKQESWSGALADITCWLNGFTQGGGQYSPDTVYALRDLHDAIKRAYNTIPPAEPPATLVYTPSPGLDIQTAAAHSLMIANKSGFPLTVHYNGRVFKVLKDQKINHVLNVFDLATKI